MGTFPHGLLFMYRLLLFAQVVLVQRLLRKERVKIMLVMHLISSAVYTLHLEMTSPVALVVPHIAVWPAYLGTGLSVRTRIQPVVTVQLKMFHCCSIIMVVLKTRRRKKLLCSHRLMLLGLLVDSFPPLLSLDSYLIAFELLNCCFIFLNE